MMQWLKDYLVSVTAASLICGIVTMFLREKGGLSEISRLITGVFLAVTVVAPWHSFSFDDIRWTGPEQNQACSDAVQEGKDFAEECFRQSITDRYQTYILNKADALGVPIQAEIILSEGENPVPEQVVISGPLSPGEKMQLQQILKSELNILKEALIWRP